MAAVSENWARRLPWGDYECQICWQELRPGQLNEHVIGRTHRRSLKYGAGARRARRPEVPPKVVVPDKTAILVEQTAIFSDAVGSYVLSVYRHVAIRARL